mgnify:CR=1 FL=1
MGLREASYTDDFGRKWAVLLPDRLPDDAAPMGLPLGPQSLESLGLPLDIEVALHNALFERRVWDYATAVSRLSAVESAVRSVYRLSVHRVLDAYRQSLETEPLPPDSASE